jgi:hypothetical protein
MAHQKRVRNQEIRKRNEDEGYAGDATLSQTPVMIAKAASEFRRRLT